MALGDVSFCYCLSGAEPVPVCGWVVDCPDDEVVLGTSQELTQLENSAVGKAGEVAVRFVRVLASAVTEAAPASWKGLKAKDIPSYKACVTAWAKVKGTDLGSSEAELPRRAKASRAQPVRATLNEDLEKLRRLYAAEEDEEGTDEEGDFEEDLPSGRARAAGSWSRRKARASSGRTAPTFARPW